MPIAERGGRFLPLGQLHLSAVGVLRSPKLHTPALVPETTGGCPEHGLTLNPIAIK